MYEGLTPEMIDEMKRFSDVEPSGFISASTNFSEGRMEEKGEFDHYIGVATTKDAWNGLDQLEVAASMWAVFTVVGSFPSALQEIWGRIYSEWAPSSGYELIKGPEILWNEHKDITSPNFKSEIWVPITKK